MQEIAKIYDLREVEAMAERIWEQGWYLCRVAGVLPFCEVIIENGRPEGRPCREVLV